MIDSLRAAEDARAQEIGAIFKTGTVRLVFEYNDRYHEETIAITSK